MAGPPSAPATARAPSPDGHGPAQALLAAAPGASAVAVGLYRRGQRSFVVRGTTAFGGGAPVDPATRFETGSLTKTFTALLFAELAARGTVAHDDPLARHLPPGTRLPAGGAGITLTHLATHTSGLPRLPPGLRRTAGPRLLTAPYAHFTRADVLRALSRTRLRFRPGDGWRYSNFGVGLLGHALCGAAGGLSYADLLAARVLRPLGLRDTSATVSPPPGLAQVTGYRHRRARPAFGIPGLPGAGAVRSSARDLLTLTEALLDPGTAVRTPPDPLRAALADVVRPRLRLPRRPSRLALIWNIRSRPDGSDLYHHSGGTPGCTAFAGFSPRHDAALVAFANCAPGRGNHLIQEAYNTLVALTRRA
ncbi:hypothetical protein GCM10018785_60430 [Streptomyces longispororuber]|uniref:Beta-lactamase-related domain-containing protein n=2 Tax=Streptomyces longispororuber TaxID=68230 RepID=A0A919A2F1_9ACTN|nr:hypothetical protein GCM10018785_60430 [Streptomyces longispororuber]